MGLWKDKTRKHWCYSFQYQNVSYAARGFKTKRDAAAARAKRKEALKKIPTSTAMGYLTVCNAYLDYSSRKHALKTFKYKKSVFKSFYRFLKKDFQIDEITPLMILKYLETRPSNNNYNVHRKELSSLFTYAKDKLEVIDRNPVKKIDKLPHTAARKRVPHGDDIIKLLEAADPETDEKDLLIVLLHTLARIDEVLRLTWDDINFERRVLTKWTRKTKDGSYKSIQVAINDELYYTLIKMWKSRKQDRWVFYNEKTNTRFYHRPKFMKGLCKRAGIVPYFGFHTLRHLMASILVDNPKISIKTIQKILGHSEARTTEIYLHSIDGAIETAMDSISGIFTVENDESQPKIATKKGGRFLKTGRGGEI